MTGYDVRDVARSDIASTGAKFLNLGKAVAESVSVTAAVVYTTGHGGVTMLVILIGRAPVGAAGGILTQLMAKAMNRSLMAIIAGGFGTGDEPSTVSATAGGGPVREVTVDDACLQLAYATKVVIAPSYGLAAA